MEVLCIADDLTGGLEVAAKFAALGARSLLSTAHSEDLDQLAAGCQAAVIDTKTRRLAPGDAFECVRKTAEAARRLGVRHVYKKTDSTLRGNIAAEFQALLEAYPGLPLVYVPAYPEMGRTVRDGLLCVNGQPLNKTVYCSDALNPSSESSIVEVLSSGGLASCALAHSSGDLRSILNAGAAGTVIVCDGGSSGDLREVAETLKGYDCLAAGPGAFSGLWAESRLICRAARSASFPCASRWLLVAGSRHPASLEQVASAEREGLPVAHTTAPMPGESTRMPGAARELARCLEQRNCAALLAPSNEGLEAHEVAAHLGSIVARLVEHGAADGLIVFGGDTASAILLALGVSRVEVFGEVLPGIPVSIARLGSRQIVLVTKAGGFGAPDLIARLSEHLESLSWRAR